MIDKYVAMENVVHPYSEMFGLKREGSAGVCGSMTTREDDKPVTDGQWGGSRPEAEEKSHGVVECSASIF